MTERIKRLNWKVKADPNKTHMNTKYRMLYRIEKVFGIRLFEYRNYKLLK
jgi:hypothetical protein